METATEYRWRVKLIDGRILGLTLADLHQQGLKCGHCRYWGVRTTLAGNLLRCDKGHVSAADQPVCNDFTGKGREKDTQ